MPALRIMRRAQERGLAVPTELSGGRSDCGVSRTMPATKKPGPRRGPGSVHLPGRNAGSTSIAARLGATRRLGSTPGLGTAARAGTGAAVGATTAHASTAGTAAATGLAAVRRSGTAGRLGSTASRLGSSTTSGSTARRFGCSAGGFGSTARGAITTGATTPAAAGRGGGIGGQEANDKEHGTHHDD